MRPVTIETLLADQKERIFNCFNPDNEIINFINDINYETYTYNDI